MNVGLNDIQVLYLQQMGITTWGRRRASGGLAALTALQQTVASCQQCPLHATRTHTVFARGNAHAQLMIIGEAPGYHEDQQGLPFVGKAGNLLNQMMQSIQLSAEDFYIANVLKCRPPKNRDPNAEEIEQCQGYLTQQINIIAPKVIFAVGRVAGNFLLGSTLPLNKMRNTVHRFQDIPVLVSYHPAYLLRNPAEKKKAYLDLFCLKELLDGAPIRLC